MIFNVEELLTQGEECPEGWTSLTGGCYKFLTGKRNWTEAKEECEKLPGWLVEIESEEQNDALYDEAREQKIGSSAWIGLTYILKARIAGYIIPQKNLNFPQICPKMPQNGPKMAKNDPKWPKYDPK